VPPAGSDLQACSFDHDNGVFQLRLHERTSSKFTQNNVRAGDSRRAPLGHAGFVDVFRRVCPKSGGADREIGSFFRRNRRGRRSKKPFASAQRKMSICEVLISVRLNSRGEVAERLKAAVC
jgi:hypothetical protein